MSLAPEDAKLFFELLWSLQYYINQKHGFHKNIHSRDEYSQLSTEKKLEVRKAMWEHPEWIEAYVRENPDELERDRLAIIEKWTRFVSGNFYIFRHLKKGSIFIGGNPEKVYSVHGLLDDLDEIIPSYALPQMVQAILLPFKGIIIYDGLLQGYNVHFGGGIRGNLNQTYIIAKQKEHIITTLELDSLAPKVTKPKDSALPQLKALSATIAKVKGDGALQTSALTLARLCLEISIADAEGQEMDATTRKLSRASTRLRNLLNTLEED